ncbi:4'-phosphopantetheinyl transferase family protein [Halomonas caseinilytica]|uniref:Enterobactin synthase component D n=1 Tax=Halomonas caseinilytica TaxID=438744 RepID=A0A1M7ACT1_9GAMM|nr:4'-phosphopantetheinyl transferase superfamily protein [Halomonas caseinilytica]SHL40359.1 4'-phosphopantetheinyl transferase superfamily protein [Halomonas caseinilytica]
MSKASLDCLIAENLAHWPEQTVYASRDTQAVHSPLFPVEQAAIVGVSAQRQREFAAGRFAAHAVQAKLGFPPTAIPMGEDRSPIWPAGMVGSLSHTADACIAVGALSHRVQAIGVDVESLVPLEDTLHPDIASPAELACLDSPPGLAALRIFSMKEAAYKAQYPLSQAFCDFDALEVVPEGLRFRHSVAPFARGTILPIRQWTGFGLCLSLCLLKRPA